MSKGDHLEFCGLVTDALGGGKYKIKTDFGNDIIAQLSGRMKTFHIKVIPGDRVVVHVSPYDTSHGFIAYRGEKPRSEN